MDIEAKKKELAQLRQQVRRLEAELAEATPVEMFQPAGYYATYYAMVGFMLGLFGAMSSLLLNVVGSALVGKNPLELIRAYLTFPLGDQALEMESGLALAVGCCLYFGTGMLLGIPMYLALARWADHGSLGKRLVLASVVSVVIWLVNYYGILSWLQPMLVPDMSPENYIVNYVPWHVAMLTHLVFGWTMAVLYPLGRLTPRQQPPAASVT